MFKILKHASGVAIVILTAWGIGAIYEWATKDYMHWLNAAIGVVMLLLARVLYWTMFARRS